MVDLSPRNAIHVGLSSLKGEEKVVAVWGAVPFHSFAMPMGVMSIAEAGFIINLKTY
jgi:hypothetical protein